MIGPVPRVYGGISAVAGAILDSDLPQRCRLTYLAEGTRQGPLHKLARFLGALAQAVWLLLRRQVDVMHLHVGGGSSFYRHVLYLTLGRLAGAPVIFHWHLPGDARAATSSYQAGGVVRSKATRWALDHTSRIVVLSPSWQPALAALTANAKIVALPNPVDCSAIHPPVDPAVRSADLLLFLGDFSPRKGVRELLAAVPLVLSDHPAARFAICGGAPTAELTALAAPYCSAVDFPGFVRGEQKLRLLQQAALLVLPSYAEGLPIAVLEAMAAGLPVVTTPVGGLPDVVQEPANALLAPPGDVPALAAAISRLLADPALRQAMGQRNRQEALAKYDLPAYAGKLAALYVEVATPIHRSPLTVHH
jgi:glycosyltransferase involved in cell wall biosynthesis